MSPRELLDSSDCVPKIPFGKNDPVRCCQQLVDMVMGLEPVHRDTPAGEKPQTTGVVLLGILLQNDG